MENNDDLFTLDEVSRALGDTKVLGKISVGIPRGKVVFVCGLSASGKSTLLNLLGLLRPGLDGGEVTLRLPGKDKILYSRVTSRQQVDLRSREFGFVLQSSYLLPYMCGRRNVLMPLAIHNSLPLKERRLRLERLLDKVPADLQRDAHRLPHTISGGQRQRLSVLRSVIHDPSVVFADEPCASLDHVNRELVMSLLYRWRDDELWSDGKVKNNENNDAAKTRTLIIVSHDVDSVLEHADEILVMRQRMGIEKVLRSDLGDDPWEARQILEQKMDGRLPLPTSH